MKKTLFFMLFLAVSGITNAQNVNIPDANFKNYLLNIYDSNEDGEINAGEALTVTYIGIFNNLSAPSNHVNNITGIQAFTNLQSLNLTNLDGPTELDCSQFTFLSNIRIVNCPSITSLNVTGLAYLTSLEVRFCGNLNFFTAAQLSSITTFEAVETGVNNAFDFSSMPLLETLTLNNLTVNELNLDGLDNLRFVELTFSSESEVPMNFGYLPALRTLYFTAHGNNNLDLSGCPVLQFLDVYSALEYLNLKNGSLLSSIYYRGGSYFNLYVCIDEGEDAIVTAISQGQPDNFQVLAGTYCSFTRGGNYNTITGVINFDDNGNGCGATEATLPFSSVQINDGTRTETSFNSNGTYNFYTQAGTFTIAPQFENDYFTATPITITFADNNNNAITQNFCITPNGIHNDVEVVIVPILPGQPGFDAEYQITYRNKGNQTLSGNVSFTYEDTLLDYVSASIAPSTATGSLIWSYSNLLPFETRTINVTLNANGPTETPAVNLDDILSFTAAITPTTGDETPTDNVFNLDQTVLGSYDPNDITCLEGATVSPDKIGEYLHYNINFENTGTAPATFIVVKDVIDTSKYDISTLQVLYASHPMEARVTGNKTEFIFDDINLAAAGKGNVTFKIKTLETLTVNSSVMQQADIFFDYNWPIVTNEATTTFSILSAGSFAKDNSVTVSPNPSNGIVNISAKAEIKLVQLYDVQGRLLQAVTGTTIDVSNRAAGIYFVKVMTAKGMKVEKLIKE